MGKTTTSIGVEDPREFEVAAALVLHRVAQAHQRGPQRSAVRALIARARRRCAEGTRADRRKGLVR